MHGETTSLADLRRLLRDGPPLVVTTMVLSIVCMNLLANKSIDTGVPWLALDCGLLFSWMAFLSMDVLTKCFGPKATTQISLIALALNLVAAGIFSLASIVPGTWSASYVEGSEEVINAALNGTFRGTWFVILGSSVAFAVSAAVNNYLNHSIGKLLADDTGFGAFAKRAYISTFTGQFVDNLVFALLVSRVFFGWTPVQCVTCAITGALLELLFEVAFSPVGYRLTKSVLAEGATTR